MPEEALSKHEKGAVDFISRRARVALTGIGIPGIIGTGTILSLKNTHVRDTFILWVFWLTVGVLPVSAMSGILCGVSPRFQRPRGVTRGLAITSIIAFIPGLAGCTILCALTNWRWTTRANKDFPSQSRALLSTVAKPPCRTRAMRPDRPLAALETGDGAW